MFSKMLCFTGSRTVSFGEKCYNLLWEVIITNISLAWMMVDEDVVYLTPSTVYRILDRYDLLYRWKRPEPG